MSAALAVIILAAGKGVRMKSAAPKVMHVVAGKPMLGHVIAAARRAHCTRIVVVTAPNDQSVRDYAVAHGAEYVIQDRQLGTGDAARCAYDSLKDFSGVIVTTYGDMPLVVPETYMRSVAFQRQTGMSLVAFNTQKPEAYGRVIQDKDSFVERIVEFKDANQNERKITLCNAGIIASDAEKFFKWASLLTNNNQQKEYYLTDIPALARADGIKCGIVVADETEVMGVNSRSELARAEAEMQWRLREVAMANGVGMLAPETVFLSGDTIIESDVTIGPFVVFGPGVTVRKGAEIRAFCHIEGAEVGAGAIVGPFARLRPGAVLEEGVHIGNFVEVKNSHIEKGAKANHLAYLGDARVGAGANIGAGTITCNYDGFNKTKTDIGKEVFVGSNATLVAPVKLGDGAYVAAGSVITKDVEPDDMAFGRARQETKKGHAKSFRLRKAAEK